MIVGVVETHCFNSDEIRLAHNMAIGDALLTVSFRLHFFVGLLLSALFTIQLF